MTVDAQVQADAGQRQDIVEAAGLTMEHVVYSQVYLDNDGERRGDGPRLARILLQVAAGASGPRCAPDADRHAGRDQCGCLPRSVAQETHRPGRISAEFVERLPA